VAKLLIADARLPNWLDIVVAMLLKLDARLLSPELTVDAMPDSADVMLDATDWNVLAKLPKPDWIPLNAETTRHTMDMDNKYFSLIQQDTMHRHYTEDRYLNIYNKQVDNNIYFMNTLLSLYGLQLINNDIRQLMSDRLKATLAQYAKPPEVEVTTIAPASSPFPTPQPSQGQTTTGSSK